MTHAKEPMRLNRPSSFIVGDAEFLSAGCAGWCEGGESTTEEEKAASRIIECYNALIGIENPAEWVERAKKALGEE